MAWQLLQPWRSRRVSLSTPFGFLGCARSCVERLTTVGSNYLLLTTTQSSPRPTSLACLACLRGASCGHMPVRRNGPQCSDPPRTPPRSPLPPHRSPWPPQPRRGFAVGHEEPSPSRVPPLQRTGSFDLMELGAHPSRRECTRTTRLAAWRRTTLELPNAPVSSRSGWQLFANTNSIAPSTFNGALQMT